MTGTPGKLDDFISTNKISLSQVCMTSSLYRRQIFSKTGHLGIQLVLVNVCFCNRDDKGPHAKN